MLYSEPVIGSYPHEIENHPCRSAAVAAEAAVQAIDAELSATFSLCEDKAGFSIALIHVRHAAGGRGTILIRRAYGYMVLERHETTKTIPAEIVDAADAAMRTAAIAKGYRTAE